MIRTARGRGFRFVAKVSEVPEVRRTSTADGTGPAAPGDGLRQPPPPTTRMLSRDEELRGVVAALSRSRLVTILGPGGVGKTTLATAVAAAESGRFVHGACWCDWSTVADATTATGMLADALGATVAPSLSTEESIVRTIGDRDLLLVADNCEHIVDVAARVLYSLVGACPRLRVLATSRSPLAVPVESLFPLAPLSCDEGSAVAAEGAPGTTAGWSAAAALFVERARDAAPALAADHDPALVEQLCRALDGLPLAIELTAARLRTSTLAEVRDHLAGALHLDAPPMRGRVPRHETLRATIEWSYRLLEPAARRLLERISVFPSGFTAEDVRDLERHLPAAAPTDGAALDQLVEHSLVVADRTGPRTRYRLLETIRSFARSQLTDEEQRTLRRCHAGWALAVAERTADEVSGPEEASCVRRFDAIFADLRAAHRFAADEADAESALRLTIACHYYALHRLRDEAFSWASAACCLPGARAHPSAPAAEGCVAQGLAIRGDLEGARDLATRALERCGEGDPRALWPMRTLSNIALYEGRLDEALAVAEPEVAIAAAAGDVAHASYASTTPVLVHAYRGDVAGAGPWLERQDALSRRSANPTQLAWARFAHGELIAATDPETAERLLEEAVETGSTVESNFVVGVALVTLASTHLRLERQDEALRAFRRVIRLWRQRGDWTHLWTTLRNLVEVFQQAGLPQEAAWLLGATTTPGRGTPTYGEVEERLARIRTLLIDAPGAAYDAQVLAGRETAAGEVVDRVEAVINDLLGGEGRAGRP